jgi:hypothetical protein
MSFEALYARVALWRSGPNELILRTLSPVRKRQNRLPSSPCGPATMGMKQLLPSIISPMTWSAESMRLVSLLVPPVRLANFSFSPS